MLHLYVDVRVSRRLAAAFIVDSQGKVLGQHRYLGDAFDQLFEIGGGRFELHTSNQVLTVEILTTSQTSRDADTLRSLEGLAPWQHEAELEG